MLPVRSGESGDLPEDSSDEVDELECSVKDNNRGESSAESMETEEQEDADFPIEVTADAENDHPLSRNYVKAGDWVLVGFPCVSIKVASNMEKDRFFISEVIKKATTNSLEDIFKANPHITSMDIFTCVFQMNVAPNRIE
ncbi:hypothetical protein FQA39_LY18773 [Lamprigera yunnana]|nr:hypothetical protein FQA39_LY18773 [Lamprigera yunnana]